MTRALLIALLACNLAACATVQHGAVQRIRVDSDPSDALVRTEDCGPGSTKEVSTPGVVWVSRRAERCTLTFMAPGYESERVVLTREIAEEFLDNIDFLDWCGDSYGCTDFFFIGGLLAGTGFGVDALTGALFEQQPDDVYVSLVPLDELEEPIDER